MIKHARLASHYLPVLSIYRHAGRVFVPRHCPDLLALTTSPLPISHASRSTTITKCWLMILSCCSRNSHTSIWPPHDSISPSLKGLKLIFPLHARLIGLSLSEIHPLKRHLHFRDDSLFSRHSQNIVILFPTDAAAYSYALLSDISS